MTDVLKEYTVIAICNSQTESRDNPDERCFLTKLNGDIPVQYFNYAFVGTNSKWLWNGEVLNDLPDFTFVLLNPNSWEDDISDIREKLKANVIVYSHKGDFSDSPHQKIMSILLNCKCYFDFHHGDGSAYQTFVENIKDLGNRADFSTHLQSLIEKSLKECSKATPHLIALSILCQGYLAAQKVFSLPIEIPSDKCRLTLQKSWWEPALREIDSELDSIAKRADIDALLAEIGNISENGLSEAEVVNFTEKVNSAYGALEYVIGSNK